MSKIDVHHHIYAPIYTEALNTTGGDPSGWYVPEWTLEKDRALCKRIGVKTAILSPTAPFPDNFATVAEQASFARKLNEYSAKIRDEDPEHYGFFAAVPSLRFIEECLEEVRYAFDVLKADGAILLSRYEGPELMYLGHKAFAPVWDELNKREAVVFIHPTHGTDTRLINPTLPQPMWDYPHETGRTAIDLITSNTLATTPATAKSSSPTPAGHCPCSLAAQQPFTPFGGGNKKTCEEIYEEAGWFYFDTALSSDPGQLAALQAVARKGHILFGSDFPNCPEEAIMFFTEQFDNSEVLTEENRKGVDGRAGKRLFPRLAE